MINQKVPIELHRSRRQLSCSRRYSFCPNGMGAPPKHTKMSYTAIQAEKSSWLDGKPFTVTTKELSGRWGLRPDKRLQCYLCSYVAKEGDTFRWQYTNDVKGAGGNPMLCSKCDAPKEEIVKIMLQRRHDLKTIYKHFV